MKDVIFIYTCMLQTFSIWWQMRLMLRTSFMSSLFCAEDEGVYIVLNWPSFQEIGEREVMMPNFLVSFPLMSIRLNRTLFPLLFSLPQPPYVGCQFGGFFTQTQ